MHSSVVIISVSDRRGIRNVALITMLRFLSRRSLLQVNNLLMNIQSVPWFLVLIGWNTCFTGFYDTANEVYDPMDANFSRLRQQQLEGEMRRDKEAVRKFIKLIIETASFSTSAFCIHEPDSLAHRGKERKIRRSWRSGRKMTSLELFLLLGSELGLLVELLNHGFCLPPEWTVISVP